MGKHRSRWDALERRAILSAKWLRQRFVSQESSSTVFLAGMQRSGTNMVMDVLERSFSTDVYHERDARAFADYQLRPNDTLWQLKRDSRAELFVLKALCDLDRLPALMTEFAPAKTVWVVRNYADVINSAKRQFKSLPGRVARMVAEPEEDDWRARGMSDETHAILSAHFRPDLNSETAIALFWLARNRLFFEQGLDRDPRVIVIRYEDLVTDPDASFRRLFDFLGVEYTPRVSAKVHARSVGRHQSPEVDPSVRELCECLYEGFIGP